MSRQGLRLSTASCEEGGARRFVIGRGAHLAGGQRGGHVEVPIVVELRGVSPAHLADHLRHLRAFEGVVSGRMKESRLWRFVEYLTAQFFGQSEGLIP